MPLYVKAYTLMLLPVFLCCCSLKGTGFVGDLMNCVKSICCTSRGCTSSGACKADEDFVVITNSDRLMMLADGPEVMQLIYLKDYSSDIVHGLTCKKKIGVHGPYLVFVSNKMIKWWIVPSFGQYKLFHAHWHGRKHSQNEAEQFHPDLGLLMPMGWSTSLPKGLLPILSSFHIAYVFYHHYTFYCL